MVSDINEIIATVDMLAAKATRVGEMLRTQVARLKVLQASKDPSAWDHPNKEALAMYKIADERRTAMFRRLRAAIEKSGFVIRCDQCGGSGYSSELCTKCVGDGWLEPAGTIEQLRAMPGGVFELAAPLEGFGEVEP